MFDSAAIKEALAAGAADFCFHLFPGGNVRYGKFHIGNLQGDAGKSLVITVDGDRAGMWKDFATGDGGSNLIELLRQNRKYSFSEACHEASQWLADNFIAIGEAAKKQPKHKKEKSIRVYDYDLRFGETDGDYRALARYYGICEESLRLAKADQILHFFDHPTNGRCWSVTDTGLCVRQDRRLDGKPFVFAGGSTAKARTLGDPSYPVGQTLGKDNIILCEGSTDLLAAYHLVYLENLEAAFAPVAILGAANRIEEKCRYFFRGKNVLLFPDYDTPGIKGVIRWLDQIQSLSATYKIFDYGGLKDTNGDPIKDLRDFLGVDEEEWEHNFAVREPLGNFLNIIAYGAHPR
ncbi:MAG: hypothetical protein LBD72_03320 [Puniceicoccales bacterium]|jgi:hypothetical protein|nr:hypothetical protein [Puniceicoccales bacterium]